MSTKVTVSVLPDCDVHKGDGQPGVQAYADAKLASGPWAYVCEKCFDQHGCSLGTGRGQMLVLE